MTESTVKPTAPGSLTFAEVWAIVQESALQMRESKAEADREMQEIREAQRETDRLMKEGKVEADREMRELREQQWETDRIVKETALQMQETDRQFKETDRQFKETDKKFKETDKKIGELSNRFGELVEHLVAPSIMGKFNDKGFNFTKCSSNVTIKDPVAKQKLIEVDIMLENGDIVMAVSTKAKAKDKDLEEHIVRMEKLRKDADSRSDSRRYQGAIATAILVDSMRISIPRHGFYLIEQTGDTVQISTPEGFVPREW
jgi:hypothetical protein